MTTLIAVIEWLLKIATPLRLLRLQIGFKSYASFSTNVIKQSQSHLFQIGGGWSE